MPKEDETPTASNAQIRARMAAHRALVLQNGLTGPRTNAPAACAFEAHDVVRCTVTQTDAARAYLLASSQQGRLFALALSEVFGIIDPALSIALDVTPRAAMEDIEGDIGHILSIVLARQETHLHTFHINAIHTAQIHPVTRLPAFHALNMARELGRLYQIHFPQTTQE